MSCDLFGERPPVHAPCQDNVGEQQRNLRVLLHN
jgi:hypothetical protein